MQRELRSLKQLRKSWYIFAFQIPWLPERLLLRDRANEIGRMLNGAALQKAAFPHEVTAIYQEAMSKPGAMTAALNYYRQIFRRMLAPATEEHTRVSAPTLLIWGDGDPALRRGAVEATAAHVAGAYRLLVLEGAGHWLQFERPDEVSAAMVRHLSARD